MSGKRVTGWKRKGLGDEVDSRAGKTLRINANADEQRIFLGKLSPAQALCYSSEPSLSNIITPTQSIGLSLADNLHDAAKGYRNKMFSESEAVRIALMKAFGRIATKIASCRAGGVASIPPCLRETMDKQVIQSKIEDSTIDYFEDTAPNLHRPSVGANMTYTKLTKSKLDEITEMALRMREKYDTFELLSGRRTINEMVAPRPTADQKKITRFILTYLLGTDEAPTYMTFDALPRAVGTLFRNHPAVCGLIIPQNIGDSAPTSFKQLGKEPDMYVFPSNTVAGVAGKELFHAERNTLSNDKLCLFYRNNGFCSKFPFKFEFGLRDIATNAEVAMSYEKGGYTQGPSLDYLIDLMRASQSGKKFKNIETWSPCLRIGDVIQGSAIEKVVRETLGGVFMDIKRGGDQDMCDAVYRLLQTPIFMEGKFIIAVTVDRLCSLLLRLLGIPCIYQCGDELTLYKSSTTKTYIKGGVSVEAPAPAPAPAPEPAPEIVELNLMKDAKFVDEYERLVELYKSPQGKKNLLDFICSFRQYFSAPASETLFERLRRNKIIDTYNRLLDVYNITISAEIMDMVIPPKIEGGFDDPAVLTNIQERKAAIEKFLAAYGRETTDVDSIKRNIDSRILLGLTPVLLYVAASEEETDISFNPARDHGYLNYSVNVYNDMVKAYNDFVSLQTRGRALREPINFDEKLNKENGYNTLLKLYTSSFFSSEDGVAAYNALVFKADAVEQREAIKRYEDEARRVASLKGDTPDILAARRALKALKDTAIAASEILKGALRHEMDGPVPVVPAPAPVGCQKGGAYTVEYVTLFKDICEKAAIFVNSELGRVYPDMIKRFAVDQFIDALERWQALATVTRANRLQYSTEFALAQFSEEDPIRTAILTVYDSPTPENIAVLKAGSEDAIASLNVMPPTLDDFIKQVSDSAANNVLEELYMEWSSIADTSDPTLVAITTLLDPYTNPDPALSSAAAAVTMASAAAVSAAAAETSIEDSAANINYTMLKTGYPLLFSGAAVGSSPARTLFLKKLLGSDPVNGVYNRVTMYSLITLAFFDDLFKGNVGNRTSLLISRLGAIPAIAVNFDVTTVSQWNMLPANITNTLIQINNNRLSRETVGLMVGGGGDLHLYSRKDHRHTRRRYSYKSYRHHNRNRRTSQRRESQHHKL